ncbi:MAG: serine hydrolase [Terricaulis sp.]
MSHPSTGTRALLAAIAASVLLAGCSTSGSPPQSAAAGEVATAPQATEMDAYLRAAVAYDQFSGTVLVARDGVPVFVRSYGMANYELAVANSPDTVFRIASLTKQFTAAAIMHLQERGRLNIDDPICWHLDNCPATWRSITIRQLLSHTSGIPNFSSLPDWDERLSVAYYPPTEFVGLFRDLPLQFEPGSDFRYSNSGYFLLGLIIERASGQTYTAYLQENIFGPLGMARTGHYDDRRLIPGIADGYDWAANGFVNAEYNSNVVPDGGGGLYSTVGDLLRWDQALYSNRLLSEQSLQAIFTPVRNNYGFGWTIQERFGRSLQGHSGSDVGFSTFLARFPSERLTVIVLSNSDRTSASKAALMLAAIALGEDYELPTEQLHDALWRVLLADGAPAALAHLRAAHQAAPDAAEEHEEALNEFGYELLGSGRTAEAISFFQLGTELFPNSANAYDSLGEAYLRGGQRAEAIRNYERSLALDPENANAERVLRDLRSRP